MSPIGRYPDTSDNGPSIDTHIPRTSGANSIAVPVIMSFMLLSLSSSSLRTLSLLWNCLPRDSASLPALYVSLIEQRNTSPKARDISADTWPMALLTADTTSPRQRAISLPSITPTLEHSLLSSKVPGQTVSKFSPPSMRFPISNTHPRSPSSQV